MNVSSLSLRDLQYLVALAQHGHFGRAANACYVSQPALSGQIKKIEDTLGVALFERSNRRVTPTEVGRTIIDQARVVLEEAEKIVGLAKSTGEALCGTFRLGAIATLGPYLLPHLLPVLRREYPKLKLVLKEGLTDGLLSELRAGRLDAILAAPTFDASGLAVFPLFHEPFVLTVPCDHPLASKPSIKTSELKASEMILLEDGHCLRDQTLALCATNRRGNIREMHAASVETLRHLVAAGTGYTLIPILAATRDERLKGLIRYKRLEGRDVNRTVVLVCRDRFPRKHEVEMLADFVRKHIPRLSVEKTSLQPLL